MCLDPNSYFNQSSDESDLEGENEEAVRQRLSKEFGYGEDKAEVEEGSREEEEEADPLEAFMAGIEVRFVRFNVAQRGMCVYYQGFTT